MKKYSFLKFTLFLSVSLFLIYSCEKEEAVQNVITSAQELTEQEIISTNFSFNSFYDASGIEKDNLKILWDEHQEIDFKGTRWYEYKVEELAKPDLEEGEITDVTYSLLATMMESVPAYWLVRMDSHNGEAQQSYFELEKNIFTGMAYVFDMEGISTMARFYEKGKAYYGVSDENATFELPAPLAARCDAKVASRECTSTNSCTPPQTGTGGCKNGGHYEWGITGYSFTDWYMDRNGDGRGQASEYSHTTRQVTRGYVWVPSGGSGPAPQNSFSYNGLDGNGHSGSIPRPSTSPRRVILDESLKGTKVLCIYNALVNSGNDLFKETIGKFIKDPKYHLKIKTGNCKYTDDACTYGNDIDNSGEVLITIEDINQSGLGVAALLLHEGIHAELWRYISQYKSGIHPKDKEAIFDYYKHYAPTYGDVFNNNENNSKNDIDHIYMTQYYINPIASALRQLDNNRYPLDYYKSYAWDGLRAYDPNNSLNMEDDKKYYKYRSIVEANTKICK